MQYRTFLVGSIMEPYSLVSMVLFLVLYRTMLSLQMVRQRFYTELGRFFLGSWLVLFSTVPSTVVLY